jgi:hypothetical protein
MLDWNLRSTFALPCLGVLMLTAVALPGAAIQPERWTHSTEADFEAGEFDGVVATNLGDLKLATAVEELGALPEDVTVVYDLAEVDGATLIAAGPAGRLLALRDGEITELAAFEEHQVFTLLPQPGSNLVTVALSGDPSLLRQYEIDGDTATVIREIELPDVRYVWDLATRQDRTQLVLATGTDGKVLAVDLDGEVTELLDTAQANVLCLAEGPGGLVYAGTDTDGLIYRIDAEGAAFVVYDAAEPEVGALLVAGDGSVYAGTADAEQAKPGRMEAAAEGETGRPEVPIVEPETPGELPIEPEPQPMQADAAGGAGVADAGDDPEAETADDAAGQTDTAEGEAEQPTPSVDPGDEVEAPATPEQLDALRAEVRKRLLAARKSGKLAAGSGSGGGSTARPTRTAKAAASSDKSGNAVYRIDPQGFVSEVFRESVMVLKLAEQADGTLLVATGNEGQLYRIDPAAGETSVLNDLEPQQLLGLLVRDDGVVVAGSNPAALVAVTGGVAESGTYTSDVLDAEQISLWGKAFLTIPTDLGTGDRVVLKTRSGNVADPEIAAWSQWSDGFVIQTETAGFQPFAPFEISIDSPPARYLQYRIVINADDGEASPVVSKVELAYVTPNLRPAITSLTAAYPDFPGVDQPASPTMTLNWEATDDNGDRLLYDLDYQPVQASTRGNGRWLELADELTDTSHEWDTRKVPDGRYRLRVTASDRLDNPGDMAMTAARRADPVLIDNSPPTLGDEALQVQVDGRTATLSGTAVDRWSPIHSVAYALDDAELYTPVLADDLIYDSTREAFSATLSDLAPGGHSLTVRLTDTRGNATYRSALFEVR